MRTKAAKFLCALGIVTLLLPSLLRAQTASVTLAGKVTDSSGKPIASAAIAVKNVATGESTQAQSDASGLYAVPNLAAGAYTVAVSASGFSTATANATLAGGKQQTVDLVLTPAADGQAAAPGSSPANLPNAPSSSTTPSLGDLGFSAQQTQSNPQLQALLEKRTNMLKIHQRLGLITVIPLAATLVTGPGAKIKGKNGQILRVPSSASLDLHAAIGGVATGMYFATAYYAMFAPRVPGSTEKRGAIRFHEAMAFIHGPGMILTPILGIMAFKQENAGEKVHGIAAAHGPVADVTALAYGAAIISVSWPIHLKFWETK